MVPISRVSAAIALLSLVACSRTPEPSASSSVTIPTTPSVASPLPVPVTVPALLSDDAAITKRCILATPATPPPFAPQLPPGRCPKDPEGNLALTRVPLSFLDAPQVKMEAELARAPHETERGLMYRTKMDDDKGMLFDLRERKEHAFWMHNTCMPLDMMFIDDDGTIVGILENVPTLNDDERTVGCPSSWVLEVVAGWSRRHNVRAGQRIALPKR
jgi:uncharacterized membrane protein (UPF0127 family)